MKRRKNAVYTGQRKHGAVVESGDRTLVDELYDEMSKRFDRFGDSTEIEIVPPEQVNPTRSLSDQGFVTADYCVRKILPEITSLYPWGVAVTPQLRALAPIVDPVTAAVGYKVVYEVRRTALTLGSVDIEHSAFYIIQYAGLLPETASDNHEKLKKIARIAALASGCICNSLVLAARTDSDLAYSNIIQYTNEMLEAL